MNEKIEEVSGQPFRLPDSIAGKVLLPSKYPIHRKFQKNFV